MEIEKLVKEIAQKAKEASFEMAKVETSKKNEVLLYVADLLEKNRDRIKSENKKDLEAGKEKGLSGALLDRLELNDKRINQMIDGLKQVAALPDPVGEITKTWRRPNGLIVNKMRIPLGVIGIIYESRPNVTIDAASLTFKSGNVVILRGGSEAINSNKILGELFQEGISKFGLPPAAVQVIPITDREAIKVMLKLDEYIDLIIPRGGEGLIRFVAENSRIPVLKHYKGVCHVYVDNEADLDMAVKIAFNAKVQRPAVCNAMETLLVHKDIAEEFLPKIDKLYQEAGVEIRGCEKTRKILPRAKEATEQDYYAEFLDLILAVKIVDDIDEAIAHIEKYGSSHTESIVTNNYQKAGKFLREVNSSTVLVNASTRWSDGYELGLGAEIGINTSKLHAYGPMGLEALTVEKFVILGNGQIRE